MFGVVQQVLDLDGYVVAEIWEFFVQRFDYRQRVRGAVEEIGIAEADVLRAGGDLLADVFEHYFALHDAERAVVHRDNWAVAAEMFAAAAGFCVTRYQRRAIG